MRKSFALASLAATLALAPALAGDTKDGWGWTFTKGEKVRYAYIYNVESTTEYMGVPQKLKNDIRLELVEETIDVKDDVATIQATLARIVIALKVHAMTTNQDVSFDSDKPKAEPPKKDEKKKSDDDDDDDTGGKNPFETVRVAIGEKFTFKMAKDGTISDVKGLDEITSKLGKQPGQMGSALLDPEVLQQTLDVHCHVFPAGGGSGDQWEIPTTVTLPSMGQLIFKRQITPKGEAEGGIKLAQVANKAEHQEVTKGAGAPNAMLAMLGKPEIKEMGFSGNSIFSREKGRILSDELTATMNAEYSFDPSMMGGGKKKADDDDDAPKKDKKKKADDDDDDSGDGKIKILQKNKLVLKYELVKDAPSTEKKDDPK